MNSFYHFFFIYSNLEPGPLAYKTCLSCKVVFIIFTSISGKLALEYLKTSGINYWPTPAESPDLNPIEMLWHELKHNIRTKVKPSNKDELVEGIHDFWNTVTHEKCTRYINHIPKVLPIVVEREGKASGH